MSDKKEDEEPQQQVPAIETEEILVTDKATRIIQYA